MTSFHIIIQVLSSFEDRDITVLKKKVRSNFNSLSGDFKVRFQLLCERYGEHRPDDEVYETNLRSLLYYLFTQCFMGKKVKDAHGGEA